MWDWLASPIDPTRTHLIGGSIAWHGRSMVLAWAVLAPLAVVIARFFKITPGQDWPRRLDNPFWWRSHWIGQVIVLILSILGFLLVLPMNLAELSLHAVLGYLMLTALIAQVLLGLFRGSKGGPTAPAKDGSLRGDHYDMTPWRRMFEALHKTLGYGLLGLGAMTILLGLWKANAPMWMWLALVVWWAGLIALFLRLQRNGLAVDTYQAIWGDDLDHPGNRRPAPGWGVRRPGDKKVGERAARETTDPV